MKSTDIAQQLAMNLPKYTDKFTANANIISLTRSGTTVTATADVAHGLAVGAQTNIQGAQTPLTIGSLTRSGVVGTLVTDNVHDLTQGHKTSVELSGSVESEFNDTFTILNVQNRKTITFTMADSGATTATGSPLLLNGSSYLQSYNGLKEITTVPSTTTFTYEITDSTIYTPASGTIKAHSIPRISTAISGERLLAAYTEQPESALWAFVVLDDVAASKSRNTNTDAVAIIQPGDEFRQQVIQPFSVYVFFPAKSEISGATARDEAEDIFRPLCQSLLMAKFDSYFYVGADNPVMFVDHGTYADATAFYVHVYNFQSVADLTFNDTVGYSDDVAFRDIVLDIFIEQGTKEDAVTANIDLDEEQL